MLDFTEEELRAKLAALEQEHQDLNMAIDRIIASPPYNELQIVRLKRKKLALKDEIVRIKNRIVPDIIA